MTFFDVKVAVFVNKIAKCRKCATVRPSTCRVGKPDLWKILSGRVLLRRHLRSRRCNVAPNLNDSCVAFEQRFQPQPAPLSMEFFLPRDRKNRIIAPENTLSYEKRIRFVNLLLLHSRHTSVATSDTLKTLSARAFSLFLPP